MTMHIDHTNKIKYEVENGMDVDFFAALKSMQQQQSSHSLTTQEPDHSHENTCLITNDPLNAFHVTLSCGHKFNYEPLYQEVLRQKGRLGIHNYHEKIGTYQIKCPYCRTFTNQLLPYVGPHPTIKRLNGVNAPAHMCMPGIECSYHNHNTNNSCAATAFYEHESNPYCLRHHNSVLKSEFKSKAIHAKGKKHATDAPLAVKCAAEIQTSKNKGQQCSLNAIHSDSVPPLCKKHSNCNVIVFQ